MNDEPKSKLSQLRIDPAAKQRSTGTMLLIFLVVALVALAAVLVWRPWVTESLRFASGGKTITVATDAKGTKGAAPAAAGQTAPTVGGTPAAAAAARTSTGASNSILTVSGYIINRERIELSPRFMGVVKWIGVKKGDVVTNHQVVVLLDDAEYQARKRELAGRLAQAQVAVRRAALELKRTVNLVENKIETQRALDLAQLDLESAQAQVQALDGERLTLDTYLDWCVIRSPIDGVVLEKLTEANELVTPQSFGGTRGPSTALISVGDPKDLQVEIDMNEADLAKVFLGQKCRVSPEAYPDHTYAGSVAEIAPEASRQKGTLQIKVQIQAPDKYLTPELSAKVDFLAP